MTLPRRDPKQDDQLAGLPPCLRADLRKEAVNLLSLLPELPQADRLAKALERFLPGPLSDLRQRDGHQRFALGDYPLAGFLQSRADPNHPRISDLQRLRALGLAATLRFLADNRVKGSKTISDLYPTVESGLRNIRASQAMPS